MFAMRYSSMLPGEMISRTCREANRIDDQTLFSCQENLIVNSSC